MTCSRMRCAPKSPAVSDQGSTPEVIRDIAKLESPDINWEARHSALAESPQRGQFVVSQGPTRRDTRVRTRVSSASKRNRTVAAGTIRSF